MNPTNGSSQLNIPVFFNGNDHYDQFILNQGQSIEEQRQIVIGTKKTVRGDGDCLYSSVYEGLQNTVQGKSILQGHNINTAVDLRKLACDYQAKHINEFIDYFPT